MASSHARFARRAILLFALIWAVTFFASEVAASETPDPPETVELTDAESAMRD